MAWDKALKLIALYVVFFGASVVFYYNLQTPNTDVMIAMATIAWIMILVSPLCIFVLLVRRVRWIALIVFLSIVLTCVAASVVLSTDKGVSQQCSFSLIVQ